jgi:hypothetical protein
MRIEIERASMVFRCPECRRETSAPIGSVPLRYCDPCLDKGKRVEMEMLKVVELSLRGIPTKDVYQIFENWLNNMCCPVKEFSELVTSAHRTLQQDAMRLFLECIKIWAKNEHWDGRNERTVQLAKKIVDFMGDELYLPHI